jgi:hypothetical protein
MSDLAIRENSLGRLAAAIRNIPSPTLAALPDTAKLVFCGVGQRSTLRARLLASRCHSKLAGLRREATVPPIDVAPMSG